VNANDTDPGLLTDAPAPKIDHGTAIANTPTSASQINQRRRRPRP
jgi:hypothetical protein